MAILEFVDRISRQKVDKKKVKSEDKNKTQVTDQKTA